MKDLAIKNLFKKPTEEILYKALPRFVMELMRKYFRLEVEGLENIPKRGAAILAPNHSGYSGFDALLLAHIVKHDLKRIPRVLTHHFWFLSKATAIPAQKMGFTEATFENGVAALKKNNVVIIFPEGEKGNFKPSSRMYQLQTFKQGFVRMALKTQAPIVPILILGAEETHINLSQLKFSKYLKGTILPLPLNVLPLPVKWKIKVLPPIYLPYTEENLGDSELISEIASDLQEQMQESISDEVQKRFSIF